MEESEPDEGFSTDQYYVPFRIKGGKTKRKPDAPFMAMFQMYASQNTSEELETYRHDPKAESIDALDIDDEDDVDMDEEQKVNNMEEVEEEEEEEKNGQSPPLSPQIPDIEQQQQLRPSNGSSLNALRERYYKRQLPKSLTPDALSNAFVSENQKAIQNDLNEDDSLLGGIKQSVQMITQSND